MPAAGTGSSAVGRAPSAAESARFGHEVERVTVGERWADALSPDELAAAVAAEVASSTARTIVLRYPARAVALARSLPATGRAVHPAGTLLYWEASTDDAVGDPAVRELVADDAEAALAVIADSFGGYVNHYAANPLIAPDAVTDGYREWAATTLASAGSRVFGIDVDDVLAGVATVEAGDPWDILLAGMATGFQGRGLYPRLVRGVLAAAAADGRPRVVISTQSHNIAVQRAWARLGFVPMSAIETVHLVSS